MLVGSPYGTVPAERKARGAAELRRGGAPRSARDARHAIYAVGVAGVTTHQARRARLSGHARASASRRGAEFDRLVRYQLVINYATLNSYYCKVNKYSRRDSVVGAFPAHQSLRGAGKSPKPDEVAWWRLLVLSTSRYEDTVDLTLRFEER